MSNEELEKIKRLERALNEFIWTEYDLFPSDDITPKPNTPSISEPNETTYYILKKFCIPDPLHPFEFCRPDPKDWKGKDWFETIYNAIARDFSERDVL